MINKKINIITDFNNFYITKGLYNLGNTCYINAALQILFRCNIFNKIIFSLYNNNFISENLFFLNTYIQLLIEYNDESNINDALNPNKLIQLIQKKNLIFKYGNQGDSDEILTYVIDEIIENILKNLISFNIDLYYRNILLKDIINDIFTIEEVTNVICSKCKNATKTFEQNKILKLSLIDDNNIEMNDLQSCIFNYLKPEILCKNNKFFCSKCNELVNATKQTNIVKYPKYLIIQLKRFNIVNNNIRKNNSKIKMPFNFDNDIFNSIIRCDYDLRGYIYHSGNYNFGHYVTVCNIKYNDIFKWTLFNDDNVTILNNPQNLDDGYIYMYVNHS